jgi:hypothetical protein
MIRHVDNAKISAAFCLPQGNACSFATGTILQGSRQNLFYLCFGYIVPVNMGLTNPRVNVIPDLHGVILSRGKSRSKTV